MAEDEEVVRKGSALYHHLLETGFTNFESYELNPKDTQWFQPLKESPGNSLSAPQWTVDHLNCILKCGLILEDHKHFIERFQPVEVQRDSKLMVKLLLCSAPTLCLFGGLWGITRFSASPRLLMGAAGFSSLCAVLLTKQVLRMQNNVNSLNNLHLSLAGLETVYIQFKRMLLLVHQSDLISQSISGHQRENLELKKKLKISLLSAIQNLHQFLERVKEIPLAVDIGPALESLTFESICSDSNINQSDSISQEYLKRLFNCYILIQSEFLRRLALCFCPDIWGQMTPRTILVYSHKDLRDICEWSSLVYQSLCQEQKFFRAIMESKDKRSHFRLPVPSSWDYSDMYVSIRSALVHFQSLLMQIQYLQDILESEVCVQTKEKKDFLSSISHILTEINKEIASGQACIDTSLVQALKMLNCQDPTSKLCEIEAVPTMDEDLEKCSDSVCNPPIEDEVFELIISQENIAPASEEDDWEEASGEFNMKKKKEGETSKRVLQELKTVLVKKADEWRERERRAMEMKGITYTAPEQVNSLPKEKAEIQKGGMPSKDEGLDFLPVNGQNEWPLPRLKGNVKTHRSQKGQAGNLKPTLSTHHSRSSLQQSIFQTREEEQRNLAQEMVTSKMGFGASLLAEAMIKSKVMQSARKEDVFLCSDDEFSSGE